ncbi:hypothetical protein [Aquicella lusitana]|uniref:Undecaprenyl phosphate-alpha-L-ara4N flippase subunit ArnE n=1 Tax=Aquicella lusitana TaxID=254246 RepID=A0A370GPF6_9COXI|nr:hypothetical protein [Aquicella lusitana]RDI45126.1 hypothetical protein C8D86_1072 [Aquicella lusitana]VVC72804.1 hypothetical protein AQULUS_05280 [Aquicella lusitana]
MTIYLSIFIVLLTAIGQVLLKKGAQLNKRLLLNKYVLLGYSTFIIVILLSMLLMRSLPLKYFSIIISFSYPTTILFANILLKEKISQQTLLACLVVVLGCILFNL